MEILEHIPLAAYTTFGIGGPARYFAVATSVADLVAAVEFAGKNSVELLVLAGGSNVLISDEGFNGLVIKVDIKGLALDESGEQSLVVAGAGENWDGLVSYAINDKLWGIENLSGIPGTVGGAVAGNIGAYGQALSQTLQWVEAFDIGDMTTQKFSNEVCAFEYRESFFKHTQRYIIVRAAFALSHEAKPEVSYKDLAARFAGATPSLTDVRAAVLEIRTGKFPDLAVEGSAGSFFLNPIVSKADATRLTELYPGIPLFDMPETDGVKVPLAWFLDSRNGVLDVRELSFGGARLFEKQPLVVVAKRNTTALDVKKLSDEVTRIVKEKIGIEIDREVRII